MNEIIDKAINYCDTITCKRCPRKNKACIMPYNNEAVINYFDGTTANDLHEMIDFYSNLPTKAH